LHSSLKNLAGQVLQQALKTFPGSVGIFSVAIHQLRQFDRINSTLSIDL
jgi:hypothetical protein